MKLDLSRGFKGRCIFWQRFSGPRRITWGTWFKKKKKKKISQGHGHPRVSRAAVLSSVASEARARSQPPRRPPRSPDEEFGLSGCGAQASGLREASQVILQRRPACRRWTKASAAGRTSLALLRKGRGGASGTLWGRLWTFQGTLTAFIP